MTLNGNFVGVSPILAIFERLTVAIMTEILPHIERCERYDTPAYPLENVSDAG